MQLSIVISKVGAGEARLISSSSLEEILLFLRLLGVSGWGLYDKGASRLEVNESEVYVGIGPNCPADFPRFMEIAKSHVGT